MPLLKSNEQPTAGSRCVNCGSALDTYEREVFIGFLCVNPGCLKYGLLTVNYRLPVDSTPQVKAAPEVKAR